MKARNRKQAVASLAMARVVACGSMSWAIGPPHTPSAGKHVHGVSGGERRA